MERLTGKQAQSLMEAVASVYEKKEDCVKKEKKGDHNCAKKVCHEEYGQGECIFGQHAVPDENGFVSHYDVQFEHGIVENVSVEELEIITEGSHNEENHHYEGDMIGEMAPMKHVSTTASGQKRYSTKDDGRHQRGETPDGRPGGVNAPTTVGPTGARIYNAVRAVKNRILGDDYQPEYADLFDIIKGHLIDEGYADTEEAAFAIMSNMSEEWRQSIVEGAAADRARRAVQNQRDGYHGDDHALHKEMEALKATMLRLKKV